MNEDITPIESDRDFAGLLDGLASQIRRTSRTESTEDVSELLYGMIAYVEDSIEYVDDSTDTTLPRDGLTWNEIAAMILEGLNKTKVYQSVQPETD